MKLTNVAQRITMAALMLATGLTAVSAEGEDVSLNGQSTDNTGWRTVWYDDFNGTELNSKFWNIEEGGGGYGNSELQYYGKEGVKVEAGKLVITARRLEEPYGPDGNYFTSGRVNTKGKVRLTHGKVEAMIRLPKTNGGLWPAFWMLGNDINKNEWPKCGEIDIMEMGSAAGMQQGNSNKLVNGTIHYYNKVLKGEHSFTGSTSNIDLQDGEYHLFELMWTDQKIEMYLDNNIIGRYPAAYFTHTYSGFTKEYFQKDFFILFNLAVGGSFTGKLTPEDITSAFDQNGEAKMYVDWVRVSQPENDNNYIITTVPDDEVEKAPRPESIPLVDFDKDSPNYKEGLEKYRDRVKSVMCYAFEDATYHWIGSNWGAATQAEKIEIDGKPVYELDRFNLIGVELDPDLDLSNCNFIHVDYYPQTEETLSISPISLAPTREDPMDVKNIKAGQWNSIDIPLALWNQPNMSKIAQISFRNGGGGVSYLTNIYFYFDDTRSSDYDNEIKNYPLAPESTPVIDKEKHPTENVTAFLLADKAYPEVVAPWNAGWNASTQTEVIRLKDNNEVWRLTDFNYLGWEWGNTPRDVTNRNYLHIDYYCPDVDATDFGLTPVTSEGNPLKEKMWVAPEVKAKEWNSYDIPLSYFTDEEAGMDLSTVMQMKFSADVNGGKSRESYIANVYFYASEDFEYQDPSDKTPESVPVPEFDPETNKVHSLFSVREDYAPVIGWWPANWNQSTVATEIEIDSKPLYRYENFTYQGWEFEAGKTIDVSECNYLHVDVFTGGGKEFGITPVSSVDGNSAEKIYKARSLSNDGWNSYNIPLSYFTGGGVDLRNIIQMKFSEGNSKKYYVANVFFFHSDEDLGEPEPDVPELTVPEYVPEPHVGVENVISLFTNVYDQAVGWNFGYWGQDTRPTMVNINNDANQTALHLENFNYLGWEFTEQLTVPEEYEYLHVDYFTCNGKSFGFTPVSASDDGNSQNNHEVGYTAEEVKLNEWNSYDVPLSYFKAETDKGPVDFSRIFQFKFDKGAGDDGYVANVYFWKRGEGESKSGLEAVPVPKHSPSDVESLYSVRTDYNSVGYTPAEWGQSTTRTFDEISGRKVIHLQNFNYWGWILNQSIDVTKYNMLHVDYFTPDGKKISVTPISEGGEKLWYATEISNEEWNSYDIPMSYFSNVDFSKITMFKFDAQGEGSNVPNQGYIANVYFWNDPTLVPVEHPAAPPVPVHNPEHVFSLIGSNYETGHPNWLETWNGCDVPEEVLVDGHRFYHITNFKYVGHVFYPNDKPIDISGYDYMHVDYFTRDGSAFSFTPINLNPNVEKAWKAPTVVQNEWNSYDVPLSYFAGAETPVEKSIRAAGDGVDLKNVYQIKYEGDNNGTSNDSYLANVYFYKNGVGTGIEDVETENGESVYYNLQGVRVDNPVSGIYIRVKNGRSEKVVVR